MTREHPAPRGRVRTDLGAAWLGARGGTPGLLIVEGEAGVGKTHLTRRWAAQAPGCVVTLATGAPLLTALVAALPELLESRDAAFLAAARALVPDAPWPVLAAPAPSPRDRAGVLTAVARELDRLARRRTGLGVLVEDVHDRGADDHDALVQLWRRFALLGTPALLVVTSRPDTSGSGRLDALEREAALAGSSAGPRLRLGPLDLDDTRELIASQLGSSFPDELTAWLHAHAEGHALHAVELLRYLQGGGALRSLGVTWQFRAPDRHVGVETLNGVIDARLRQVMTDPDAWPTLTALATLDAPATPEQLAVVSAMPLERASRGVARLFARGYTRPVLLGGRGCVELTHPLLGAAVLARLDASDERALHHAAVAVAASEARAARHARLAGHADAVKLTRAALERAVATFDHHHVIETATALRHAGEPDADALRLTVATAAQAVGDFERALREAQACSLAEAHAVRCESLNALARFEASVAVSEEPATDRTLSFRLLTTRARALTQLGRYAEATAAVDALLGSATNDAERAAALLERAWLGYQRHRREDAYPHAAEAARLLRADGTDVQLARALNLCGLLALATRPNDARAHLVESAELLAANGYTAELLSPYTNLGVTALLNARLNEASEWMARALRIAEAAGAQRACASLYANAAYIACMQGDAGTGERLYARALALYDGFGQPQAAALQRAVAAVNLAYLGDTARAEVLLRGHDGGAPTGTPVVGFTCCLAQVMTLLGRASEAVELLQGTPVEADTDERVERDTSLARAHLALGFDREAEQALRALVVREARDGHALQEVDQRALLALALWKTGQFDAARQEAEVVLRYEREHGYRLPLAFAARLFPERLRDLFAGATDAGTPGHVTPRFLRSFGGLAIEENGLTRAWRAKKPRELIEMLLAMRVHEDGPALSREQIITALWPDGSPGSVETSFRMTLMRAREALGHAGRIERDARGRYALVDAHADVLLFLEALARDDLEAAVAWYRGDFIPEASGELVAGTRAALRTRWRVAALRLADELDPPQAATVYRRLLDADPLDMEAATSLADALHRQGEPTAAASVLAQARADYLRDTGSVPRELLA